MNNKNLTQADKAREYCKAHGIRLYISPISVGSSLYLLADLTGKGELVPIAEVKNNAFDFESGYTLFWEAIHAFSFLGKNYKVTQSQKDLCLAIAKIEREAETRALEYYSTRPDELANDLKTDIEFRVILDMSNEGYYELTPFLALLRIIAPELHEQVIQFTKDTRKNRDKLMNTPYARLILKKLNEDTFIQRNFTKVLQGTATNKLTKLNSKREKQAEKDPSMDTMKITREDFSVMLLDYTKHTGLRQSAHQLLDALLEVYTNSGGHSELITLPLKEYMNMRGLRDEKSARQQVKEDLDTLENIKFSFTARRRGKQGTSYFDLGILQHSKGIMNGVITVYLETAFHNLLGGYKPMPYPLLLWKLSENHNPHAFYFLRKISEHKYMNAGKTNEDIIAVLTLLEASPNIPTYEEVAKTDRHYDKRIITPFEDNMDTLDEAITWEYCHSNNIPLTDEELSGMNYEIFRKLYVRIYWRVYPDQTERLAHKALMEKKHSKPVKKQSKMQKK